MTWGDVGPTLPYVEPSGLHIRRVYVHVFSLVSMHTSVRTTIRRCPHTGISTPTQGRARQLTRQCCPGSCTSVRRSKKKKLSFKSLRKKTPFKKPSVCADATPPGQSHRSVRVGSNPGEWGSKDSPARGTEAAVYRGTWAWCTGRPLQMPHVDGI